MATFEPVYKRELKFDEKTKKLTMHNTTYVPVPKEFSNEMVKQMKNGKFYEDIVSLNGEDYLPEDKFNAYKALAKALKNT